MMIAVVFILFAALIVAWLAAPTTEPKAVAAPASPLLSPAEAPA